VNSVGNTIITVPAAASVVPFTPTARAPRDEAGTAKATKEAAAASVAADAMVLGDDSDKVAGSLVLSDGDSDDINVGAAASASAAVAPPAPPPATTRAPRAAASR